VPKPWLHTLCVSLYLPRICTATMLRAEAMYCLLYARKHFLQLSVKPSTVSDLNSIVTFSTFYFQCMCGSITMCVSVSVHILFIKKKSIAGEVTRRWPGGFSESEMTTKINQLCTQALSQKKVVLILFYCLLFSNILTQKADQARCASGSQNDK
jgi:hypothetical protein